MIQQDHQLLPSNKTKEKIVVLFFLVVVVFFLCVSFVCFELKHCDVNLHVNYVFDLHLNDVIVEHIQNQKAQHLSYKLKCNGKSKAKHIVINSHFICICKYFCQKIKRIDLDLFYHFQHLLMIQILVFSNYKHHIHSMLFVLLIQNDLQPLFRHFYYIFSFFVCVEYPVVKK